MENQQKLVKLTFFARRKPHLSEAELHHHWSEVHKPLVCDWLAKYGIVKYTQYHTTSAAQASAVAGLPLLQNLPKLEFDAVAEFVMPDASCFSKAREDPYFEEVVKPDEDQLFDWETAVWTVGWELVCIENGKPVDGEKK